MWRRPLSDPIRRRRHGSGSFCYTVLFVLRRGVSDVARFCGLLCQLSLRVVTVTYAASPRLRNPPLEPHRCPTKTEKTPAAGERATGTTALKQKHRPGDPSFGHITLPSSCRHPAAANLHKRPMPASLPTLAASDAADGSDGSREVLRQPFGQR